MASTLRKESCAMNPTSVPHRNVLASRRLGQARRRARISRPGGSLSLVAQLQIDPSSNAATGAPAARPGETTERDRMMAVTVDQLLPRLLAGLGEQPMVAFQQHLDVHGPPADLRRWAPQKL